MQNVLSRKGSHPCRVLETDLFPRSENLFSATSHSCRGKDCSNASALIFQKDPAGVPETLVCGHASPEVVGETVP